MIVPWHLRTSSALIESVSKNTVTGAKTYTAKTGMSAVPCTVQPDMSTDALKWSRETGKRASTIALPVYYGGYTITVLKDDRITVGGVVYRVVGPGQNCAGLGVNQIVKLEEDS